MICATVKWIISRALDSDKAVPAFARRHVDRCVGCRRFMEFSLSLETALASNPASFAQARESKPAIPYAWRQFRPAFGLSAAVCLTVLCLIGVRQFGERAQQEISAVPASLGEFLEAADATLLLASGDSADWWSAPMDDVIGLEIENLVSDAAAAAEPFLSAFGLE